MKKSGLLGTALTKAILFCAPLILATAAHGASSVTFGAGNESAQQNVTVGVPIDVSGFTTVSSFQFTLQWDPAVLSFQSESGFANIGSFNSGNFGINSVGSGLLTVSWDDPNVSTDGGGVSLSDASTLFLINFSTIGNVGAHSDINFTDSPTVREVIVNGVPGTPANFISLPGGVDVVGVPEPSVASLGILAVACGAGSLLLRRRQARS